MATVKERFESRLGGGSGPGSSPPSRVFTVRLDALTQDPVQVVHGITGSPTTYVPIYSIWPDGQLPAFAGRGIARERMNALSYVVEVPYFWIVPATYQGWLVSLSGALETEHIKLTVTNPKKIIGPNVYRYLPQDESQFFAEYMTFGPTGQPIGLERLDIRRPVGIDITKPTFTARMTKRVPVLELSQVGPVLANSLGRVNTDTFIGAPPGALKFASVTVDPRIGEAEGVPTSPDGIYWEVALEFVWDARGHSPYKATHTVTDELGNEGIVYTVAGQGGPGAPVTEDFDVYKTIVMGALLSVFP